MALLLGTKEQRGYDVVKASTPAVLSFTRHMLRRWLKAKGADDLTAAEVVLAMSRLRGELAGS